MKMREGLSILFSGKDAFQRHLSLFSVCGTVGIFDAFIVSKGIENASMIEKCGYISVWMIFALFFIGFETKFLHIRRLPDVDLDSFGLAFKKVLFLIFLAGIPLIFAKFNSAFLYPAFFFELILAVPFTAVQAGYSYKYDSNDALMLFKKLTLNDYLTLIFKRLWIIISAYTVVFSLIFVLFFTTGIFLAIIYQGDTTTIGFEISANRHIIEQLSSYISEILLVYALTVGTLVWDYELLKTYESEV